MGRRHAASGGDWIPEAGPGAVLILGGDHMLVVARRVALSLLCFSVACASASVAPAQDPAACPSPEPRWHTEAWYRMRAQEPVGARQVEYDGKLWPPYARPVGPKMACVNVYHAEHYWPWPYMCTDRQVVLDMTRIQEANGWLSETTLYDYHFHPESHELTVPGKLQLKWILENVPANYRTVWVQQAEDPAISEQRINSVRSVAGRLMNQANLPAIAFRPATAPGRPAIEVDTVRRKELETIPSPRVAFETGAANSSGSGGGGSSQGH
jgi:hypothetical protein